MGKKIYTTIREGKSHFQKTVENNEGEKSAIRRPFVGEMVEMGEESDIPEPSYLEKAFSKIGQSVSNTSDSEEAPVEGNSLEKLDDVKIIDFDEEDEIKKLKDKEKKKNIKKNITLTMKKLMPLKLQTMMEKLKLILFLL